MKKLLVILFCLLNFAYAGLSNASFIGSWKISQLLTELPVGNLTQKDIDNIMNKTLIITPTTITLQAPVLTLDDRSCTIDTQDSGLITDNPLDYFQNQGYSLNADDVKALHLTSPFWSMESFCMQVFSLQNPNKLILFFGAGFFEADRFSSSY